MPLVRVVAVPLVRPVHVPVDLVAPPRLVQPPLVVHVEDVLQEAAAQPPEISVLLELALTEPERPVPTWERRAVGGALRLEERQAFVDQYQRDGIVAGHRACILLHLIVVDTHDLQHRPGTVIVRAVVRPAAGTSSVQRRE